MMKKKQLFDLQMTRLSVYSLLTAKWSSTDHNKCQCFYANVIQNIGPINEYVVLNSKKNRKKTRSFISIAFVHNFISNLISKLNNNNDNKKKVVYFHSKYKLLSKSPIKTYDCWRQVNITWRDVSFAYEFFSFFFKLHSKWYLISSITLQLRICTMNYPEYWINDITFECYKDEID